MFRVPLGPWWHYTSRWGRGGPVNLVVAEKQKERKRHGPGLNTLSRRGTSSLLSVLELPIAPKNRSNEFNPLVLEGRP